MRTKTFGFASSTVAFALVVANACTFGADDYEPVFSGVDLGGSAGQGGEASGGPASGGQSSGGSASGGESSGGSDTGGNTGGTGEPGECSSGSFDDDDDPTTDCEAWTDCKAGEHVDEEGTATSDRKCAFCEEGTFSTEINVDECTDSTVCDVSFQPDSYSTKRDVICGGAIWQFGSEGYDTAEGVDTDQDGNVFVTGQAGTLQEAYVRKYDGQGAVQWSTTLGEGASGRAVAVDDVGNSYVGGLTMYAMPAVTGTANAQVGLGDAFVSKIDASGVTQWTRQFGTTKYDYVEAVEIDGAGNTLVVGHTIGSLPNQTSLGLEDAFVRKYSPTGEALWTAQFGSSADDYANGVAVDSGGNVFVAGYIGSDAFIAKYSAGGTPQWTQSFGTDKYDWAYGLCADDAGNLYVAGSTAGQFDPAQGTNDNTDGFLRRYSANGSVVWTRQFEIGGGYIGSASCSAGSVFLVGTTSGTLPGVNNAFGAGDAFVIEYDAVGD
jgi:hypothetical protein